ncbi:sodium/hydrogen exchanger 9B2-like isoform X1 [Haliotis rufescens]|uniref:sodium/hydrogen exchanger 9B2-like isoform X1 n=1 Tax=Haliotis rufescens TaxID=6454 RepID=UPI00201F492B|nr:sodium/hydrogen exchanger 9B2-like isoform X1 [Haliotis rufescens]XP_046367311.2 sodium/hydrogen exchanger 9B2-like isoform X1 [Haliotis rufescens]XP_046367312.2 sodium/hydrogen exchanger 9B2-like isoform X1 [Haliotis rufescens]XP_046367313.2 sodium/hydrogen exchanger 9B2-like isoform X1 [Haliotis rufescens]XP_046367314.2 sodium/hydrogen exchanger 9B2-like isoform X1 [Haliotis rufescens]XP_046367315.2 sodium/hydrogen exchanger 9B2-like isoform X1 [Haliotis rufescens]XP_048256696.1 sodium/h
MSEGQTDKAREADGLAMQSYSNSSAKLSKRDMFSEGSATMDQDGEVEVEISEELPKSEQPKKCLALRTCCHRTFKPIQTHYNPLPENATLGQRVKYFFMCPPHGKVGGFLVLLFMFGIWLAVLISLTGAEALPGGNLFALLVLFVTCWFGGYLVSLVKNIIPFLPLPPLLGMLLVGGLLRNVPQIAISTDIHRAWSSGARNIALGIILLRAGLGLDPSALRKLSFVVVRLAFSPCLMETTADAVAAHLLLGFPWEWGFMLGFVIAAVSPAVVVPCLLSLQEDGYGVDKGIPTLVIAAASVDDVLAITGFGVVLGIAFSQGNLAWTLLKGPLEAVVGVALGTVAGVILWYFPQRTSKNLVLFRSVMLVGFGLMAIFLSTYLKWAGSGPLGCLTLAFVAALKWRKEFKEGEQNPIENVVGVLWMIFQPLLFGLIASEVEISSIDKNTIGLGLATLGIGLAVRMVVSFLAVFFTPLNLRERMFIPFAWLPKATVQAAIGAKAYEMAISEGKPELENLGKQILTIAVLAILITAPIGAALVTIFGPKLLKKTQNVESPDVVSDRESHAIQGHNNPVFCAEDESGAADTKGVQIEDVSGQEARFQGSRQDEMNGDTTRL